MNLEVVDLNTGFRITPDRRYALLLMREIRHEKKARRHATGIGPKSEPGCVIIVRSAKGRERQYQLYDRTVLLEVATNTSWQFYFGVLLTEWLKSLQPPPQPLPWNPIP